MGKKCMEKVFIYIFGIDVSSHKTIKILHQKVLKCQKVYIKTCTNFQNNALKNHFCK